MDKIQFLHLIDLSKSDRHEHPDIKADGTQYLVLVKYSGCWYLGVFSRQWYGLNFKGIYDAGCQFDEPGWNSSEWETVIEIDLKTIENYFYGKES